MRTVGVVVILGVAVALSISMLVARDAVTTKINSVKASTGTTITVSPAGFFGFTGSGTPLSATKIDKILNLSNVASLQEGLTEDLSSSKTSLTAPSFGGPLGQSFGSGSSSSSTSQNTAGGTSSNSSSTSSTTTTFTQPVRVVGTNSPGTALVGGSFGGGTETLVSGKAFSATSTGDVAVVGKTLATKNNLKVGSTFTAWGKTVTVVGIYNSGSTFANSDVLMPLATVQKLASATGEVTSATVTVNTITNVASVQAAVKKLLGSTADVTSTYSTVESELTPLNSVKTISTYTLIGSVVGASIILLLSMLMIVRERRREIGVLKALGAPSRSIIAQFVAESTTFTLLGSLVGLLGGVALASPITSALVNASSNSSTTTSGFVPGGPGGGPSGGGNGFAPPSGSHAGGFGGGTQHFHFGGFNNAVSQIHAAAGWSVLGLAFLVALIVAAIGSTVAAGTIVRIRPAEVLRSE